MIILSWSFRSFRLPDALRIESPRGRATNNFSFVRVRCSFVYILLDAILVNRQPPDGYVILVALGAFRTVQPRFVRNLEQKVGTG